MNDTLCNDAGVSSKSYFDVYRSGITYLYCDAEFSNFGGKLISLALVEPVSALEFYRVREIPDDCNEWVLDNVVPVLNEEPSGDEKFRDLLWAFMRQFNGATIVADWPEDIGFFASMMCKRDGVAPRIKWDAKLIDSGPLESAIPHNALEDARALARWCVQNTEQWVYA